MFGIYKDGKKSKLWFCTAPFGARKFVTRKKAAALARQVGGKVEKIK